MISTPFRYVSSSSSFFAAPSISSSLEPYICTMTCSSLDVCSLTYSSIFPKRIPRELYICVMHWISGWYLRRRFRYGRPDKWHMGA